MSSYCGPSKTRVAVGSIRAVWAVGPSCCSPTPWPLSCIKTLRNARKLFAVEAKNPPEPRSSVSTTMSPPLGKTLYARVLNLPSTGWPLIRMSPRTPSEPALPGNAAPSSFGSYT